MNPIEKKVEEGMILLNETKESSNFFVDDFVTNIHWTIEGGFQYFLSYKKRTKNGESSFEESFNDFSLLRKRMLDLLYEILSQNFKESFESIQNDTKEKLEFFLRKIEGK